MSTCLRVHCTGTSVYKMSCECATHKCHSAIIACIHIIACIINYNYCVIEDEFLKREEGEEEEKEKELFQLPSDGLIIVFPRLLRVCTGLLSHLPWNRNLQSLLSGGDHMD